MIGMETSDAGFGRGEASDFRRPHDPQRRENGTSKPRGHVRAGVGRPSATLIVLALLSSLPSVFAETTNFTELSLEDLLEVRVVGASKYEQRQDEIAASVSVLIRADIKAHG